MAEEDPRLGYTSASNAEADFLCPGRHIAQRGLAGYENREAAAGTAAHAVFAGTMKMEELSPKMRQTVSRGSEIEQFVVREWFRKVTGVHGMEGPEISKRAHRELRLWAYLNGQKIHSGGIDALWLANDMKQALVEDLKSLFGDVDDAASNLQLRDYAALVYLNYGCEEVSVFINQPNVRWQFVEQKLVTYKVKELEQSVDEMKHRVLQSNNYDASRIPGLKQCNFCLACGTSKCPESLQVIRDFQHGFDETWQYWDEAKRGEFIALTKLAEWNAGKVLRFCREELRKNPGWAAGWTVTKDSTVRHLQDGKVRDVSEVLLQAFSGNGWTSADLAKEIQAICSISIGDLEVLHERLTETGTYAERREEFKNLFGHLIKTSPRSGSLKPLK